MKSFLSGLAAVLVIGLVALFVRNQGLIPSAEPTPTPTSTPSNWDMEPETATDPTPAPSSAPTKKSTTKGGQVLSTSDSKIVTTTTKTISHLTILESSDCLLDATSFVRDLTTPLKIMYSLKDDYTATVTIWKESGESVLNQTLISGTGVLTTINELDNLKFQIVSKECVETSDTWLKITASK